MAYLSPDWRHGLDLGDLIDPDRNEYAVTDDRWAPGTTVVVWPTPEIPQWWDDRDQPDADLMNLLRRTD